MLEFPLLERSNVTEFSNRVTEFSKAQNDSKLLPNETQTKLNLNFANCMGSLHSLDSANACGALGRGFESLRARMKFSISLNHFEI